VLLPYSFPRLKRLESKNNGHLLPGANQDRSQLTGTHVMITQRVLITLMELRFNYKTHGRQLPDVDQDKSQQTGIPAMITLRVHII